MSLPVPPKRFALGKAPFASLSVSVSLPAPPTTEITRVLATVGLPNLTATAPPFTSMRPAASRLITMELSCESPTTVRTPSDERRGHGRAGLAAAVPGQCAEVIVPAPIIVAALMNRRPVLRRRCVVLE